MTESFFIIKTSIFIYMCTCTLNSVKYTYRLLDLQKKIICSPT